MHLCSFNWHAVEVLGLNGISEEIIFPFTIYSIIFIYIKCNGNRIAFSLFHSSCKACPRKLVIIVIIGLY